MTLSAGPGVSLSSNSVFDANQSSDKTITVGTNGTTTNTASTLVLRGSSGEISVGAVASSSNVTASGFLVSGQSGFLKADGTVDNTQYLSNGNIKDSQITVTTSEMDFLLEQRNHLH